MAMGIECFRVLFPKGMDANEYALKVSRRSKVWGCCSIRRSGSARDKPPAKETVEIVAEETLSEEPPEQEAAKEETSEPVFSLAAEPLPAEHPPAPAVDVPIEVKGEEIIVTLGDRRYRIRGLAKN